MPTWAITDDTSSIAIAQNGVVIKNIDKDIVVLRIVPAGVGLNTSAIDQLYIEHDGEYSTQIPYNDVTVSGVSPSSVENFRTRVLTILNNNGGGGGGGVIDSPIVKTVNQAQAFAISDDGIDGQVYRITSGATPLPTGVAYVEVKCTVLDTDVKTWDFNGFAFISSLMRTVPCQYDVATNTIQGEYVLWAGYLSQSGGGAPTVDSTAINISGETPTISYLSAGDYTIVFTGGQIISDVKCQTFTANYFDGADSWISYCNYYTANQFRIQAYKIANNGLRDDGLNHTYIQIKINL